MSSFSERLKSTRLSLDLTQSNLADSAGVSQQLIQQIESGAHTATKYIFALADALNCDARWLQTGELSKGSQVCTSVLMDSKVTKSLHKELEKCKKANNALLDVIEWMRGE